MPVKDLIFEGSEVLQQVKLCDKKGKVNPEALGWSRSPLFVCNLPECFPRVRRRNGWSIVVEDRLFMVNIDSLDYVGEVSASIIDLKKRVVLSQTRKTLFAKGITMSDGLGGVCSFHDEDIDIELVSDDEGFTVSLEWMNFSGGSELSAEIRIPRTRTAQSAHMVLPLGKKKFSYAVRHFSFRADGFIRFGKDEIKLSRKDISAVFEFSRGITPLLGESIRGSVAFRSGKDSAGFSFGKGVSDDNGLTANILVHNGVFQKIRDRIDISQSGDGKEWLISSRIKGLVNITFTPFYGKSGEISREIRVLGRIFGSYSGTISTGKRLLSIRSAPGWIEIGRII